MVQEEKLKEANRLYKDANEDQRYVLELLFPELKQSEDEKIRQELLQIAKESEDTFYMPMTPYKRKRIIAWFEKHGDYSRLVEEMKKRKELLSKEKENATSDNDKLSLGGRIAILEELLAFSNEKQGEQKKSYDICDSSMMDSKKSPYGEKRDFGYFEEKPTDKVEPNFNFEVGQWIVATGKCVYLITKIDGFDITLVDTNGDEYVFDASSLDDAHLWDIRDAKDGDVIVCPKYAGNAIPNIFIFKGIAVNNNDVYCHCSFSKAFISTECYIASVDSINTDFYPATIEQRAILSKEMTNAGYTFDFENKELKNVDQETTELSENKRIYTINVYYPNCGSEIKEAIEQGIACCKTEKKEMLISLNDIFLRITPSSTVENVINEYNNYTGKNTVIKEKTNFINQWNSNDESYLNGVITDIECEVLCANCSREIADLKIEWLKSLKERVLHQPKQEWSKEDENNILFLTSIIEECFKDKEKITLYGDNVCANFTKEDVIDRLKSLRPQNTWKPSDEQMEALDRALSLAKNCGEEYAFGLRTLQDQLKKLK